MASLRADGTFARLIAMNGVLLPQHGFNAELGKSYKVFDINGTLPIVNSNPGKMVLIQDRMARTAPMIDELDAEDEK